ncbi:MAG: M48 family metalloprotease [Cyclonatronaceae bacterium]
MSRVSHFYAPALGLLLPVLLLSSGCVSLEQNPVTGNTRAYAYSWEEELEIGREADGQISTQYGVYEEGELNDYIQELSQDVLQYSHMRREGQPQKFQDTEFTFRILNSDIVNAFALPGGYVYFTRGLLAHMNNEAQLAVVIGHEIGHVAARHASKRALQQQAGQLLLVGGAVAGQELFGVSAQSIMNLGGTAAQLLFLSYSRGNESESDELGVEYAAMAGFDASEGSAFFQTLQRLTEKAGGGLPNHLSSHPDPGNREQRMIELSQRWKDQGYEQNERNAQRYMEMIDGIIVGKNPREGYVEGDMFYHPELRFEYPVPAGWRVQNEASQVIMTDEEQGGVSVFSMATDVANPRAAVEQFTGQEGINVLSSGSENVNGLNAYRSEATATDADGTTLRVLVQAVAYDGNIYRVLNYSEEGAYDSYKNDFELIADGFSELTNSAALNVQPTRIEVVRADRTGSFSSFLPDESVFPQGMDAEAFAILNQVSLDETITRGQRLKLPRR